MLHILLVEDSPVERTLLRRILEADPEIQVIAEAEDGAEAVALVKEHKPDLVVMDLHLPVMDGIQATRRIMESSATPIIIVTASDHAEGTAPAFQALEAGALHLMEKPRGPGSPGHAEQAANLIELVKIMAEVKVVTRRAPRSDPPLEGAVKEQLVGIVAASTGGPAALATILERLPGNFPVPVLVVQHISEGFEEGLARWLASLSELRVTVATEGKRPQPGEVLIAPTGVHIGVNGAKEVEFHRTAPVRGHRPSATLLFQSVARAYGPRALAVILTGMGKDGVEGLRAIKAAGGRVIAQDETSSAVHGMPQKAKRGWLTGFYL